MAEKLLRKSKSSIIHVSVGCSGRLQQNYSLFHAAGWLLNVGCYNTEGIISFLILNSRSKTFLNDHELLNRLHNRDNL